MWKFRLSLISAMLLCGNILHYCECFPGPPKKSWSYTPISINSSTSDESKFKSDISVKRITRREVGLAGTFSVHYDMNEESTIIEGKSYRSAMSNMQWKILPFVIKKQGPTEFMNGFYKEMLMNSLKGCSNLPTFESQYEPPFGQQDYKLNDCVIAIDNMPDHMQEGYYKLEVMAHGEVEWMLEIILQVETVDD